MGPPQLPTITASSAEADTEGPLGDDIIVGAENIAIYLFGTPKARRTVYRLSTEVNPRYRIPTFKMGHITLCVRKSSLKRWIAEQEIARMSAEKEGPPPNQTLRRLCRQTPA